MASKKITYLKAKIGKTRQAGQYVVVTDIEISTNLGDLLGNIIITGYELKDEKPLTKIRIFSIIDRFRPTISIKDRNVTINTLTNHSKINDILFLKIEDDFKNIEKSFKKYKKYLKALEVSEEDISKNFSSLSKMGIFLKNEIL